jgi:hypothetical protein
MGLSPTTKNWESVSIKAVDTLVLVYSAGSRYTRADMRNDFLGDNAIAICHGMPPMVLTIIRFYPLLYDSRN